MPQKKQLNLLTNCWQREQLSIDSVRAQIAALGRWSPTCKVITSDNLNQGVTSFCSTGAIFPPQLSHFVGHTRY